MVGIESEEIPESRIEFVLVDLPELLVVGFGELLLIANLLLENVLLVEKPTPLLEFGNAVLFGFEDALLGELGIAYRIGYFEVEYLDRYFDQGCL